MQLFLHNYEVYGNYVLIIPINYSSYRIPIKLPVLGLYSANTAQIYPEDRGTNYSVDLGQKVTNIILEDENGFIKR